jgi:hypothetical protein
VMTARLDTHVALFFEERVGSNVLLPLYGGGGIELRSPAAILARLGGALLGRTAGEHLYASARTRAATVGISRPEKVAHSGTDHSPEC